MADINPKVEDKRILIVEDERIVAKDIEASLINMGYKIAGIASSGEEAVKKAKEENPDLILMDIVLQGDMDGIEASQRIRLCRFIPIVYLTAYADIETLDRAKLTQPFGYIIKPFEDRDLRTTLEMALYKHKMEKNLIESEEWFSTTLKSLGDAVIALDANGIVKFMNPVAEELTGWTIRDAEGLPIDDIFNIINEITGRKAENPVKRILKEGIVLGLANHTELIRRNGTKIPVDDSGAPIKDPNGNIIGAVLVFRDVSSRRMAEKKLKASEEKYRFLFENTNFGICIWQDNKAKFPNPMLLSLMGYAEKELDEIDCITHIHPHDKDMVLEQFEKTLNGATIPDYHQIRILNKDEKLVWVEINTVLITWDEEPAVLCFIRDITRQKKLEAQLFQAQKMEAIGTLAGGIAHDFNNLLMGIQGNASLASFKIDTEHPAQERLRAIEEIVQSGSELTRQLLGFARKGRYENRPSDLRDIIEKSADMFARTSKGVQIYKKFHENLWIVDVDRGQIEQVFLNLCVNAWQAMPKGGNIYIEVENIIFNEQESKAFLVAPGKYVKTSITDNGIGMDEETQKKIFEPFFTTKEMNRGTGLGLASVYGIIQNHFGFINVYSEKGIGTTFNIYLPASDKEIIKKTPSHEKIIAGSETILLVDDEKHILETFKEILTEIGYKVITAENGDRAVEIYAVKHGEIDIVILDMIMPGKGGEETYSALKGINPKIKVLFASGYALTKQVSEMLKHSSNGFIHKPFNMMQLTTKLRNILNKKS